MSKLVRPKVVVPIIVIAAAVVAGVVLWQNYSDKSYTTKNTPGDSSINYGPPTQAQQHPAGVNPKDKPSQAGNNSKNNTNQTDTKTKQKATVMITTWAQKHGDMTVNGFVQEVVEDGGTCTLTLTKDGITRSESRPAKANATNTTCGENDIPVSQLSPGTWQAVLSYSSTKYVGQSAPLSVEVSSSE